MYLLVLVRTRTRTYLVESEDPDGETERNGEEGCTERTGREKNELEQRHEVQRHLPQVRISTE